MDVEKPDAASRIDGFLREGRDPEYFGGRTPGMSASTILFCLVARDKDVLAEYTPQSGNFTTVTLMLLNKFPREDGKMSYLYDSHMFHYVRSDGIIYLCMTDMDAKRRVAFAFLADVRQKFVEKYGDAVYTANAFAMNQSFAPIIKRQMEYFNDPSSDSLSRVRNQLDDVKSVMVENIDKILERSEKIELLVDKTHQLAESSTKFEKSSRSLRRNMWWKNFKMRMLIAFIVAAIIGVIVLVVVLNNKK